MSKSLINPREREGSTHPLDEEVWARTETLITEKNHLMRDVLESFPLYARRINLARFLARYELYKMVQDLPGCIFECGVYRGAGLMTWAKILEIFSPGDRMRKVIGFDNFKGFTALHEKDGKPMEKRSKVVGGWNPSEFYDELLEHIEIFNMDSYVPRAPRITLVEGDIGETAPQFIENNPGIRISLLNIDMDIYEPTLAALTHFYPYVAKGGIVVLDEYGVDAWGGEAKAFEEYFVSQGLPTPTLKKLSFYSLPGAYFVKE
jgi:hypothetical protein